MTTLEEPSQHPPPGSLLNDVVSGRHRSLHSIKCYPSVSNGLQGGSGSVGGAGVVPNGWEVHKDGHSHGSGGHMNGSVWNRTKGSSDAAVKLLQAQHQQLTYCTSVGGGVSTRLHPQPPHHGSGSSRQERQPYRSHSERSGRWPPNADKGHHDQRRHEDDREPSSVSTPKNLCRSNSSLDLLDQEFPDDRSGVGSSTVGVGVGKLNREYGSASSIDVMSMSGESFFDLLKVYNNNNVENHDQRSPGPSNIAECLRGRVEPLPVVQNASNTLVNGIDSVDDDVAVATSPKNKTKFHKLWEIKERKGKNRAVGSGVNEQQASIFRKLRGGSSRNEASSTLAETSSSKGSDHSLDAEARNEEKLRKKAFAHYDVQSVSANLSYAVRLRSILGMRRNTTTGASAASMANRNASSMSPASTSGGGSTEDLGPDESDFGDGRSNELVLSCPFFRNELGGEDERVVSLTRTTVNRKSKFGGGTGDDGGGSRGKGGNDHRNGHTPMHRPNFACGLSILEGANDIHWKTRMCPYQRHALQRENVDHGALYYKNHYLGRGNVRPMVEFLGMY